MKKVLAKIIEFPRGGSVPKRDGYGKVLERRATYQKIRLEEAHALVELETYLIENFQAMLDEYGESFFVVARMALVKTRPSGEGKK